MTSPSRKRAAVAVAVAAFAASAATAHAAELGQTSKPTPIRAYRGAAVWSTAAPKSNVFTLMYADAGGVRALPATARRAPVEAGIGRGPDGKPLIVLGSCHAARCGIDSLDPASGARRRLTLTSDGRAKAASPAVWGDRLTWIEHHGRGDDRIYTARISHRGVQRVPSPLRGAALWELALLGRQLAVSLGARTIEQDQQVRLQELDGSRRRVLRTITSGEADRSYVGLSFDGGALYFAQVCSGDPSGCAGHGTAYRYSAGTFATAPVPLDLSGFAHSTGSAYWVAESFGDCLDDMGADAPCGIEQGPLTFTSP